MLNVIREYLVSLGYRVDMPSFQQAQKSIEQFGQKVSKAATAQELSLAAAGTTAAAYVAFIETATVTVGKFVSQVGQAAIQNEIFAREMWMNYDAAVAYRNSLKALGASLQDLYLSPTLMNQFIQLRQQASQMSVPGFQDAMKGAQNLTFQFERLKLEASYSIYWIGYYLTKYLAGPIGNAQNWMQKLNDAITKNMPVWTKDVAQVAADVVRLANAISLVGQEAIRVWDSLGEATKKFLGMMTGAGALILTLSNPITALIAGMTALLLLVDDYYTYENHGQSALPKLWAWIDQMNKKLQDTGVLKTYRDALEEISVALVGKDGKGGLLGAIGDVIQAIVGMVGQQSAIQTFASAVAAALKPVSDILTAIAGAIKVLSGTGEGIASDINAAKGNTAQALREDEKARANMQGGLQDLLRGIGDMAYNLLNAMGLGWLPGLHPDKKASGGTSSGGPTLVGEQGPELVNLPVGAQVTNHDDLLHLIRNGLGNLATAVFRPAPVGAEKAPAKPPINVSMPVTVTVTAPVGNPQAVGREVAAAVKSAGGNLIRYLQGVTG